MILHGNQLLPERVMERAQGRSHNFLCYLALQTLFRHFRNVLAVSQVGSIQCVMGICKGVNTKNQESCGAILEANYPFTRRLGKP